MITVEEPKVKTLADGLRFAIQEFDLTAEQVKQARIEALLTLTIHEQCDLVPGTYRKLVDKERSEVVMSDCPMERRTNQEVMSRAKGHVLVAGLGLGMILKPMLKDPRVKSITVVEKEEEIIVLNMMVGFNINHRKLRLVTADIFTWEPPRGMRWDTIYFDIWNCISKENFPQMKRLHGRFRRRLAPRGWMESWRRMDCREKLTTEVKNFYTELIRRNPLAGMLIAQVVRSRREEEKLTNCQEK